MSTGAAVSRFWLRFRLPPRLRFRLPLPLPPGRRGDAAVTAGVFVLVAIGGLRPFLMPRQEPWAASVIGWMLSATVCAALCFRRRYPVAVAVVALVGSAAYYLISEYDGPLLVALVVALYAVAADGRLQAAVGLASLTLIAVGAGTLSGNRDVNGIALFMLSGWLVGVVALGWVRHSRRAYAREAEQRAVSEERLRIARELHDAIGHHISLVHVQSAAALRRLGKDPVAGAALAEEALGAIKDSSREALRELRATLGVLRRADEAAPTAPLPGLNRIDDLVVSARLAGIDVRTLFSGERRDLPTEVELAVYRIVQESLTNVTRHAARATAATIRVDYGVRELTVEITDDGHGGSLPAADAPGSGVTGMRERARALGGELTAGPRPLGFGVRACLPYECHGGSHREPYRNGASPPP
ncbi:sensor histidine kinase [Streptomyces sp. NPDC004838]